MHFKFLSFYLFFFVNVQIINRINDTQTCWFGEYRLWFAG